MSNSSDETGLNEEDIKMQRLLAEWDENDDEQDDLYVDSDDDDNDKAGDAKKKALLKKKATGGAVDDSDDDDNDAAKKKKLLSQRQEDSDDEEDVEADDEEADEEEASEEEEEEEEEDASEGEDEDEDESEEVDAEDGDDENGDRNVKDKAVDAKHKESSMKSISGDDKSSPDVDEDEEENGVVEPNDSDEDDDQNIEDTLKKKPKKSKNKVSVRNITEISEDDDPEAAEMKKLLAGWGDDNENDANDDDDDDDDDDDTESEASEREVELLDGYLDHIVLAAPDLEEAKKEFERMAGVEPVVAGTIKGLGIKCARVSFNDASYLEIIAPDEENPGPIGELLKSKNITGLTPFHYAIRSSKAESLKDEVKKFGYIPDHISMFSAKKDGTPRKWELLYLYKHNLGGICPFFINWANSDHPCATLPIVGKLKKFTIRAPENDPLHSLLNHIVVQGINIEMGKPKLSFQFSSPEGTVKFATSKAVGFKFPGFDTDDEDIDSTEIDYDAQAKPEQVERVESYEDLPVEY